MKYVKEFATHADYTAYVATDYPKPNVSLCVAEGDVYYNPAPPPPFFCKLTLKNGEVVDIEGSGELTSAMTSSYKSTCVGAEIGTLCTSIGNRAFSACTSLTSVTIPDGVTRIGDYAFLGCAIRELVIPDSVTRIGSYVFSECSQMKTCTLGSGVTNVSNYAFYQCWALTSMTIPDSVTGISQYAFRACDGMTDFTIGSGVTYIGDNVFFDCYHLTSVTINSNSIVSKNYSYSASIKTYFGTQVKEYIIGDNITSIGNYAFYQCSGLTSVTIPDSVTSIGTNAFNGCSGLTSVTIPDSVTSIGGSAFNSCSSLSAITSLAVTAPTIQNFTFYNIKAGGTLTVPTGSSGYDVWMGTGDYYLGKYNWTKVEQ